MPSKPTFLVHSGDRLMPSLPPRASRLALSWLKGHGCKVSTPASMHRAHRL
jgi:hypothetical protein